MRAYTVDEQRIEVTLKPFGAFVWLVVGFEVRIGPKIYHPKLDGVGFNTRTEFDLEIDAQRVSGEVRSLRPTWFIPKMHYAVCVAGQEVARDVQMLRRWYLHYAAWALLIIILLLALLGAFVVPHLIEALQKRAP